MNEVVLFVLMVVLTIYDSKSKWIDGVIIGIILIQSIILMLITIISAILKLIGFIKWCRKEDNKIHIEQVQSKDKTLEESKNADV